MRSIHHEGPDALTATDPEFPAQSGPPRGRSKKRFILLLVLNVVFGLLLLTTITLGGYIWIASQDLPQLKSLENYRPWRITRVYDLHRKVAMEIADQRRRVVPYQSLPKHLIQAIVSAEDSDFFSHKGLDYMGIFRAFLKNLRRRKGSPKQGGSTITQQVVKTFLLSPRQTYTRKLREAILSRRLEKNLRKWEILYLYLNQIDFGRGCYGVEEASRYYFGKSASKLTVLESAILAGIPKNPERYNPVNSIALTTRRRNYVLSRMWKDGHLSKARYEELKKQPVKPPVATPRPDFQRSYYTELIRKQALEVLARYIRRKRGIRDEKRVAELARNMLYRGGLQIETALSPRAQKLARSALQRGLRRLDRRRGFRGPIAHIPKHKRGLYRRRLKRLKPGHNRQGFGFRKALITRRHAQGMMLWVAGGTKGILLWSEMAWARRLHTTRGTRVVRPMGPLQQVLQPGDVIWVRRAQTQSPDGVGLPVFQLEQIPRVQGALIAIDPRSHRVRALVGGWDFRSHPFNRATMGRRQPGSAFKPIVYAAAIASKKYTAASTFPDVYLEMDVQGKRWVPTNGDNKYSNKDMRMRDALAFSTNTVAVRLLTGIGPYRAIAMARRLGIRSQLTLRPSLALGASAVQPLELTNAYATFAAQGVYDEPVLLNRILTHNGIAIMNRLPNPRRVIAPGVAHITTSMLQDVVRRGTAKQARALGRPIAGKTGTTNRSRNAWFIGYTPDICVGVWVGFDNNASLGPKVSGSSAALPIFVDWMKQYHKRPNGKPAPPRPFHIPDDVIFVKIDPASGDLAPPQQAHFFFEAFLQGTQPTQYANNHGPTANPRDFYKLPE